MNEPAPHTSAPRGSDPHRPDPDGPDPRRPGLYEPDPHRPDPLRGRLLPLARDIARGTYPTLLAFLRAGVRRVHSFSYPRCSRTTALVTTVSAVLVVTGIWSLGVTYSESLPRAEQASDETSGGQTADRQKLAELRREKQKLAARLDRLTPDGRFVVIDHTHNRLYLRDGGRVLLDATCSTGSGFLLVSGKQRWVFDTPRGKFNIEVKMRNPVWRKPDWAFVEEGLPLPSDPNERFERGALGEYGLYIGNGYLIHGTLYERLLGRSVTHGCIRVGREDLRFLYRSVDVGTPVYIY